MDKISEQDKKFMKSLNLKEEDLAEAKENLFGFFGVLNRIYERLKKEGKLKLIKLK